MSWFRESKRSNHADKEFLPAAIEILETPASPVRAAMIWLICIFTTTSLIWAYVGTFDIVSTAQGKLKPAGRVKIVQSEEAGRVLVADASNGEAVKKGDILIELDSTTARAEEQELAFRLEAARAETARRQALREVGNTLVKGGLLTVPMDDLREFVSFPKNLPPEAVDREQQIYDAERSKLTGVVTNLRAQYRKATAQVDRFERTVLAQEVFVSTLSQRVAMRRSLIDVEAGTKSAMIDAQETLQEAERDLTAQRGEHEEAITNLDVILSEARSQLDMILSENMQRLGDVSRELDQVLQELVKARRKLAAMTIRAPDDGIVQASAITTIGQVVTPGTELMRIVPNNKKLEIEAYLPNKDIGFVEAGQEAVIKVEAFPFTRYGILHGKVIRVATDAIPEPDARQLEEVAAESLQSSVPLSNAQRVQNLVYSVVIEPPGKDIVVGGRSVPLSPGMAVTVEIKTGQRRILEYLFSPLAEVASGAMKER